MSSVQVSIEVDRLRREFDELREEIGHLKALQGTTQDVALPRRRGVLASAGSQAEAILKFMYRREGMEKGAKPADKMMLEELITALRDRFPEDTHNYLKTVQSWRNMGTHDKGDIRRIDEHSLHSVDTAITDHPRC